MALDEYFVGITRYIPAQTSHIDNLVTTDDVKSPLQIMPMYLIAQSAYALGIDSPYWQYRSVLGILGALNFALLALAVALFAKTLNLRQNAAVFWVLIFALYFAGPFTFTRPMFESMGAPWLALATVFALRYDWKGHLKDLLWGVFCISMAFVLRQQLGICALVFLVLPILKKNVPHLAAASLLGGLFIIVSGLPDIWLRGEFHYSLKSILFYNVEHGKDYGSRSVLYYPALLLVLSFFPFLIARYPQGFCSEQFKKFRSVWMVLILFVFLHSLFPQKWERFLISVLPQVMMLAFPFLWYLHQNWAKYRWRLGFLYAFNLLLLFLASFFPPQKNLIEMSRYLDQHPEIQKIYRISETPEWITDAFIRQKNYEFVEADNLNLGEIDFEGCKNALVLGEPFYEKYAEVTGRMKKQAEFNVNYIERLAYRLNPEKNVRRVQLSLYCNP